MICDIIGINDFSLKPETKKFSDFMLIFQYHEKAESSLKEYLADLISKKVSPSFKLHRKDKMHLQLEPQKLPGLRFKDL